MIFVSCRFKILSEGPRFCGIVPETSHVEMNSFARAGDVPPMSMSEGGIVPVIGLVPRKRSRRAWKYLYI